jgi:hypothetical protein
MKCTPALTQNESNALRKQPDVISIEKRFGAKA